MRALNPREKKLAYIIAAVLTAALFKYGFWDLYRHGVDLNARIAIAEAKLNNRRADLAAIQSRRAPASAELNPMMKASPERTRDFARFMQTVASSLEAKRARTQRFAVTALEEQPGYARATYTLTVLTNYLALGRFLEELENSEHWVEIRGLQVSREGEDMQGILAEIELVNYIEDGR